MKLRWKGMLEFHGIFLAIYCTFNILGIYPFSFYKNSISPQVSYIFLTGLIGFIAGYLASKMVFKEKPLKATAIDTKKSRSKLKLSLYGLFGLVLIVAIFQNINGIIILNPGKRMENSAIASLITLSYSAVIYYYYSSCLISKRPLGAVKYLIVFYVIILMAYGYRSPIITLVLMLAFLKISIQTAIHGIAITRKQVGLAAMLCLAIVSFGVAFEYYRLTQSHEYLIFFQNIDIQQANPLVILFIPFFALMRYDQEIMDRLYWYFSNHDHLLLELFFSNILTVLPGDQLSARSIIGSFTTERVLDSGKPWSITATIQGNLYVDGGYPLVFVGFALIALLMRFLKYNYHRKPTLQNLILYAFLSISLIKTIHGGYFDVTTTIIILVIILIGYLLKIRASHHSKPHNFPDSQQRPIT